MSKTVDQAIAELQADISAAENALREKKRTVNVLCGVANRQPLYALDAEESKPVITGEIRSDQFYGQPLATAARAILEMRKARNLGAASVNEIHEALVRGGYHFDTKTEEIARNSLRNSLAKNTALFHKLPNGQFGLSDWYPKKPRKSQDRQDSASNEDEETAADTADSN